MGLAAPFRTDAHDEHDDSRNTTSRGRGFAAVSRASLVISIALFASACGGDSTTTASVPAPRPARSPERAQTSEQPPQQTPEEPPAREIAPPPPVVARTVRIVPLSEHELLGSETRALAALERALDQRGFDAVIAAPDEAEAGAARGWVSGSAPTSLPEAWRTVETVVVVQVVHPLEQRSGRRLSRGIDAIVVLRPPSLEPVFRARGEPKSGFSIATDWGAWLADLLDGIGGGEG